MCSTSFVGTRDPQKLIWIDTQGSLTHIVEIFKFGNVSGPWATKWPKVNHWLKIVNYFKYAALLLSRYSNSEMTQSKLPIKNSKLFYMYVPLPL